MSRSGTGRKAFEVDFPTRWNDSGEPVRWLGQDMHEVARPPKRLLLKFHLWPTMGEQIQIDTLVDTLSGGIGFTIDLQNGITSTHAMVQAEIEHQLWPGKPVSDEHPEGVPPGAPEVSGDAERATQQAAMDKAWDSHTSRSMQALQRMSAVGTRLEVAAQWRHLIIDPPSEWADLAGKDMRPNIRETVIQAWVSARAKEEQAAGK